VPSAIDSSRHFRSSWFYRSRHAADAVENAIVQGGSGLYHSEESPCPRAPYSAEALKLDGDRFTHRPTAPGSSTREATSLSVNKPPIDS